MSLRILFLCLCFSGVCFAADDSDDMNVILMNATFMIGGPQKVSVMLATEPRKTAFGTVFFVGKLQKTDPTKAYFVLVTAAHVLNEIDGDIATLVLRRKSADGTYSPFDSPIKIRQDGKPLY